MKCPHCRYFDGWDVEEIVTGEYGHFFESPVKVERRRDWDNEQRKLYACPKCRKTFIDT